MKAIDTDFTIQNSAPGLGKGLFARVPFNEGDFIVEYTGKKIATPYADTLTSRYLFEIDREWTIDGETEENVARYINHSCDPNAEAAIEASHINIYAAQEIAVGEEITIDYGDEYYDEFIRPVGCKCKSARHR